MKHVFIVNPAAGKASAVEEIVPKIKEFFSRTDDYKIYITEKAGDGGKIARAEAETGEQMRIYACGGEGTCFEILNGVIGFDNVAIGTIPCGSANDFLKFFGEKHIFYDLKEMTEGKEIPIDLIKANEFYCINQCSAGMDAIVAEKMQKFKRWPLVSGSMAYKMAIVQVFFGKIGLKLKITVDNKSKGAKDCLFAVCANGPVYGGGYKSAPLASPFDQKLDYIIVDTISKLQILSYLKMYEKGTHTGLSYCEYGNCTSMVIEADTPFPLNLDGEIIMRDKVKFEIVKKAVRFVVPRSLSEKMAEGEEISSKPLILNRK